MNKRKERQTRTMGCKFSIREDGSQKRLEGYFSVFGGVYELWPGATESVDPHAFDDALTDDIRALIDHETRLVLGRTTAGTLDLRVDETGLFGSVLINEDDQDAMNLYARVQRGDVSQCSFGFDILEEETDERRTDEGRYEVHWTIKKVKLYEVSVVTFPAYRDTEIAARKEDFAEIRKRRFEVWKNQMLARLKPAGEKEETQDAEAAVADAEDCREAGGA
jgi:HK97 family phage prohead protease